MFSAFAFSRNWEDRTSRYLRNKPSLANFDTSIVAMTASRGAISAKLGLSGLALSTLIGSNTLLHNMAFCKYLSYVSFPAIMFSTIVTLDGMTEFHRNYRQVEHYMEMEKFKVPLSKDD